MKKCAVKRLTRRRTGESRLAKSKKRNKVDHWDEKSSCGTCIGQPIVNITTIPEDEGRNNRASVLGVTKEIAKIKPNGDKICTS